MVLDFYVLEGFLWFYSFWIYYRHQWVTIVILYIYTEYHQFKKIKWLLHGVYIYKHVICDAHLRRSTLCNTQMANNVENLETWKEMEETSSNHHPGNTAVSIEPSGEAHGLFCRLQTWGFDATLGWDTESRDYIYIHINSLLWVTWQNGLILL